MLSCCGEACGVVEIRPLSGVARQTCTCVPRRRCRDRASARIVAAMAAVHRLRFVRCSPCPTTAPALHERPGVVTQLTRPLPAITLTMQVLGNAKGIVAVVTSILIFRNPVTTYTLLGYSITVAGVIAYSQAKKRQRLAPIAKAMAAGQAPVVSIEVHSELEGKAAGELPGMHE